MIKFKKIYQVNLRECYNHASEVLVYAESFTEAEELIYSDGNFGQISSIEIFNLEIIGIDKCLKN